MLGAPTPSPELGKSEVTDSKEEISSHMRSKPDGLGLDIGTIGVYF